MTSLENKPIQIGMYERDKSTAMRTIDDILNWKGNTSYSLIVGGPVLETISLMDREEADVLLFIEAGNLVVMVSEGDSTRKVILARKSLNESQLRSILSKTVIYPSNTEDVKELRAPMHQKYLRYFPIMLEGLLVGEISLEDFSGIFLLEREGSLQQGG